MTHTACWQWPRPLLSFSCVSVEVQKNQEAARMPKPKVYSTHPLFEEARKILDANCDVQYWSEPERPPARRIFASRERQGRPDLSSHRKNQRGAAPRARPNFASPPMSPLASTISMSTRAPNAESSPPTPRASSTKPPPILPGPCFMAVARRLGEGELSLAPATGRAGISISSAVLTSGERRSASSVSAALAARSLAAPRVSR